MVTSQPTWPPPYFYFRFETGPLILLLCVCADDDDGCVYKDWLEATCCEYGWSNDLQSPVVWRELVRRGGRRLLIGGANEFREYASAYYDVRSSFTSAHLLQVDLSPTIR